MTLQDLIKYFKKIDTDQASSGTQTETAQSLYNNAILLVKTGRLEEAKRDLREAVRRAPGFDDAYMLLGLTSFELGNRIESLKTINQISDGAKHSQAMKFYDLLCRDSDEPVTEEGTIVTAAHEEGEEERRARQSERMEAMNNYRNLSLEEETGSDFRGQTDDTGRQRPKKFIGNVVFDLGDGLVFEDDSPESYFSAPDETEKSEKPEEYEAEKTASAPENEAPENDPGDTPEAGLSEENESEEKTAQKKNIVFMTVIAVICVALIAAFAALSVTLHKKGLESGRTAETLAPAETPKEKPTAIASDPPTENPTEAVTEKATENPTEAATETATEKPTDTATGAPTEKPTETPTETSTEIPTEIPTETPTEIPTETPTTDPSGEALKEQLGKLEEAKSLFASKQYYECAVLLTGSDWSMLDGTMTAEKNELASKAIDNFTGDYFNIMYKAVGTEDWQTVLDHCEAIITFKPDFERGAELYFHAGKAAFELKDEAKAEKYLNATVSGYPESKYSEYARYILSKLDKS